MTRRALAPRKYPLRFVPVCDLEAAGLGLWRATGRDPQFIAHSDSWFPSGPVFLELELDLEGLTAWPSLYLDCGTGFTAESRVLLAPPILGRSGTVVRLPRNVRALRLDPIDEPGRFQLTGAWLHEISPFRWAPVGPNIPASLRALGPLGSAISVLSDEIRPEIKEPYTEWLHHYGTLGSADYRHLEELLDRSGSRPTFSIILPVEDVPSALIRQTVDSIRAQVYGNWELCAAEVYPGTSEARVVLEAAQGEDERIRFCRSAGQGSTATACNSALQLAGGEYAVFVEAGDVLESEALAVMALVLRENRGSGLIYSDEDSVTASGEREQPRFKPDWSPEFLLNQNYVGKLAALRRERVASVNGCREGFERSWYHDLLLRYSAGLDASAVVHVASILCHSRLCPAGDNQGDNSEAGIHVVEDALKQRGRSHSVVAGGCPGTYRIQRAIATSAPLVSLLIPTRDGVRLLERCLNSIFQRTVYPSFEVVVVDNGSTDPTTLDFMLGLEMSKRARVLRFPGAFNYSAINNFAARAAMGDVLCLLNDDTEVISSEWLSEMVALATEPDVGAVGAKLYFPDGSIQHAGLVAGLSGLVDHLFRGYREPHSDALARLSVVREVTAVTGACLVVRKSAFEEVGGLNERHLAIAYSDVELCFKLLSAGYRNLWTPHARLYHHESATRGSDDAPGRREEYFREVEYLRRTWGELLTADPFFNPNLSLLSYDVTPAKPPRVAPYWAARLPP